MSNELAFSEAELKLLREKYRKLSNTEFDAFLSAAKRYQLNPLANQFYARLQEATEKNPRNVTYMAQIDGYRLIADRTGLYAGNDDPRFDNEHKPTIATVSVYKIVGGRRCKFEASARMEQYRPKGNAGFMWDRMPHLMLGKCAEALALRKAFPAQLAGLYTHEEMQQADDAPKADHEPPVKESVEFQPPKDWPATEIHDLRLWIDGFTTNEQFRQAMYMFLEEPMLSQQLEDWEIVLKHLAADYKKKAKQVASKEMNAVIKAALDKLEKDKLTAEGEQAFNREEVAAE